MIKAKHKTRKEGVCRQVQRIVPHWDGAYLWVPNYEVPGRISMQVIKFLIQISLLHLGELIFAILNLLFFTFSLGFWNKLPTVADLHINLGSTFVVNSLILYF